MADVFVSYASADRARVWPMVDALAELGWSVWWDREIQPGRAFEETIDREIRAAACIVVVWSASSVESRWVRNEALEGLERDVLVPVRLDEVRIPVAFKQTQGADFSAGFDRGSKEFGRLTDAIAQHVAPVEAMPGVVPAPPRTEKPTFAVLPLRMVIEDMQDQFLIEALNDGITARLARLPGFFAVSSSSTMKYLGQSVDSVEVGRALGVRYVIDGTLRRAEAHLHIMARLSDVDDGHQLWSAKFNVESGDLEAVEERIVRELVATIEPELARAELSRSAGQRTTDMDAWALYRQAASLFAVKGWRENSIREAVAVLDMATAKDPNFALAYALKSVLLGVGNRLAYWSDDDEGVRALALRAADTALDLDESDSNVLGFAGCTLADFGVEERSLAILDKAIELDPSNAQAYVARATLMLDVGDVQRALADCQEGLRLSPRDPRQAGWFIVYVMTLLELGRVDEAVAAARYACRRDTRNFAVWLTLAVASVAVGDPQGAGKALQEARILRPDLTMRQVRRLLGQGGMAILDQAGMLSDFAADDE